MVVTVSYMHAVFKGSGSFEALNQEGKIAVASSVTVFTVASIAFFIIGFLCGHVCQKKRKPAAVETDTVLQGKRAKL